MQELMVDFITSLDGYGAAKGWPGLWGLGGPEYLGWLADQPENNYTVLMGAKTYPLMSEMQAGNAEEGGDSLEELTNTPKVVFSSTLQPPLSWKNTRLISSDTIKTVGKMKREEGKSMRTLGSLSLCRSLLKAGLVDRFRVVVFPVINGITGYDRIYDGYPEVGLDMITNRTFDGRLQLLEDVPRVLARPPGVQS
jgi:dihydrofolate reductase